MSFFKKKAKGSNDSSPEHVVKPLCNLIRIEKISIKNRNGEDVESVDEIWKCPKGPNCKNGEQAEMKRMSNQGYTIPFNNIQAMVIHYYY